MRWETWFRSLAWETGRKDVYRLRPGGSVTLTMQFREFAGMFMEHCHNTVHEDHAMLIRWEIARGPVALPTPNPTPQGVEFTSPTILPTCILTQPAPAPPNQVWAATVAHTVFDTN